MSIAVEPPILPLSDWLKGGGGGGGLESRKM